jgi:DNA-binding LacI/PurR family transcriptional regulator
MESMAEAIGEIADAGFPQFLVSGRVDHPGVAWLDADNIEPSAKATQYLIHLGHRRIAFMSGTFALQDQFDRFVGYKQALERAGFKLDNDLVMQRQHIDLQAGASAIHDLLTRPQRPTAIYFGNSELAFGAIKGCRQLKLAIPEDISMICFDDCQVSEYVTPSMTCLRQPAMEMGRRGGQFIASQLKNHVQEIKQEVLVPDFFINESTGPAPAIAETEQNHLLQEKGETS